MERFLGLWLHRDVNATVVMNPVKVGEHERYLAGDTVLSLHYHYHHQQGSVDALSTLSYHKIMKENCCWYDPNFS